MKYKGKLFITMFILCTITISIYLFTSLHLQLEDDNRVKQVDSLVAENLGQLEPLITKNQKQSLYYLYLIQLPLYERRIEQDRLYPGPVETLIMKLINNKLESYTKQYLFIEESLTDKMGYDPYHNYEIKTLRKIKDYISGRDYNQIVELYSASRIYNKQAKHDIASILSSYPLLNADTVKDYLTEYKAMNHNVMYDINTDLTLTEDATLMQFLYSISSETSQLNNAIWDEAKTIIPNQYLTKFEKIEFLVDREDSKVIKSNYEKPILTIDPLDFVMLKHKRPFYESILHQVFHLILLDSSQVEFSHEYEMDRYCEKNIVSNPNSYLNTFYNQFWKTIYSDRMINEMTFQFFVRHHEAFVSPYAATNPSEDLAETFSYFVLDDKPKGNTIKDKKIIFLYQFPELVNLRNEIRNSIY